MTRRFVLPGRETSSLEIDYETGLNEQQLAVVTCGVGPKIVIAGAGSGKTRTLTYRVAHLLEQGVAPAGILLVTFTNKAARDLPLSLRSYVAPPCWASWLHRQFLDT